ncbi:1683_t:CDS:2, partial [Paraglomus brasilianum]
VPHHTTGENRRCKQIKNAKLHTTGEQYGLPEASIWQVINHLGWPADFGLSRTNDASAVEYGLPEASI